jgi:hypothetical protein
MKTTNLFKLLLAIQAIALLVYSYFAFNNEGANLMQIFFSNVMALSWNGQFNLDFLCYLTLSGLWIMWRNRFSTSSVFMGILAMIMGIIVFAPYILYLLNKENGDLKRLLIGNH